MTPDSVRLESRPGGLVAACFTAMASSCELLLPATEAASAPKLGRLVAAEAGRIERKYSRYRNDSIVARIHSSAGHEFEVDRETALLFDFAQRCHELSDGLFDITSGVLRRAWKFDQSDRVPSHAAVEALLPLIGFEKLHWNGRTLRLAPGMEVDFGGIGKEYAVDRAFEQTLGAWGGPFLINFGGDLRASRPLTHGPWQVGVEQPDTERKAALVLQLESGALATSGDSRRFLLKEGVRYGHILDPRSGWPVTGAPRSVSVAASSCTEAGMLATIALLRGQDAEAFLQLQGVRYWLQH